jgi:hypothetical protein
MAAAAAAGASVAKASSARPAKVVKISIKGTKGRASAGAAARASKLAAFIARQSAQLDEAQAVNVTQSEGAEESRRCRLLLSMCRRRCYCGQCARSSAGSAVGCC